MFRSEKTISILFKIIIISLSTVLIYTLFFDYSVIISHLISLINLSQYEEKINSALDSQIFILVQIYLVLSIIVFSYLHNKKNLYKQLCEIKEALLYNVKVGINQKLLFAITIPVFGIIFFAYIFPVTNDEAYTYLNYASHTPLVAIMNYKDHNNHILNSILVSLLDSFSLFSPVFSLRFPTIIVAVLTALISYSLLKKMYSEKFSLVVVSILMTSYMSFIYSFISRGYGIIQLAFVVCLYCVVKINKDPLNKKYWLYFSISSIVGFYAVPSFLFAYISLIFYLLSVNKKHFRNPIKYTILTIIFTSYIYFPTLFSIGLNKSSDYFERPELISSIKALPLFLKSTLRSIFGANEYFIIILLAFSTLLNLKHRNLIKLALFLTICPIVLMLISSLIPFPRTFAYLTITILLFIFIPIRTIIEKSSFIRISIFVIFIQLSLLANNFYHFKSIYKKDIALYELSKEITNNNSSYYINGYLIDTFLLFESISSDIPLGDIRYNTIPGTLNSDTISGYDYVVISNILDHTSDTTQTKIKNEYFNVY